MQECVYCNLYGYQESGHHGEWLEGFKMWTNESTAFIYSAGNPHREVTNLHTISQEQKVIQKATHPCHRDGQRQIHQTDPKLLTVQILTQPFLSRFLYKQEQKVSGSFKANKEDKRLDVAETKLYCLVSNPALNDSPPPA